MKTIKTQQLTRSAILLALLIVFQSLRLIIPIPPFLSIFIIGSLVNTILIIAVLIINIRATLIIGMIAPIVAYLQGFLPMPVFIIPIILGNWTITGIYYVLRSNPVIGIISGAIGKTILLYTTFNFLFSYIVLPENAVRTILFTMSWPQLVTGLFGGFLALAAARKTEKSIK